MAALEITEVFAYIGQAMFGGNLILLGLLMVIALAFALWKLNISLGPSMVIALVFLWGLSYLIGGVFAVMFNVLAGIGIAGVVVLAMFALIKR